MKYLKTFEELSPEVYKNAAKGILSRARKNNLEEIEEYERITGRKASELQKLEAEEQAKEAEEQAKEKAKELEDFAKEREKHWDEKKQMYNLPPKKD